MKKFWTWLPIIVLAGCAGLGRECSSCNAENFGSDWIIVQQRQTDGRVYNCWLLRDTSVANEGASDGIYWKSMDGHLVHIAGQYSRVQVENGKFKDAAKLVGIDAELCRSGAYPAVTPAPSVQ